MDWVDPEIGQKQLHPESRSRGGEMQSINSFREVEDYQRWRPEIAWVELVWVILGVVGTGPLTIRGWDATCQVIPIMYFKTSSKVLKNLSSGFLTWSPRPAPNTRLHHSQCECTEEPPDLGSLHAAPQPWTRRPLLKILKPCSSTCLIISFTNSATPPPNSPLSAAIGRKELGYSSTYNWDWLSRKYWNSQAPEFFAQEQAHMLFVL